jgi:hypothetical protein
LPVSIAMYQLFAEGRGREFFDGFHFHTARPVSGLALDEHPSHGPMPTMSQTPNEPPERVHR